MRNLIYKILKESEDDFDWAKDLYTNIDSIDLPIPDGNRYLVRFKQGTRISVFRKFNEEIELLGWRSTDSKKPFEEYSLESLENYSTRSKDTYVHLKPDGTVSIGSNEETFHSVNGVWFRDVKNFFYN